MSKILLLSDIHGRADMAAAAAARHPEAESILIAGDITNFGGADSAEAVLAAIAAAGAARVAAAVPGNCDRAGARRYLSAQGLDPEGRVLSLPFAVLVGIGGGLRRAGITSFERTEKEFYEILSPQFQAARRGKSAKPLIALTHSPPYGTNADRRGEQHVGSFAFARLMEEYSPHVWICGHIHESSCVSTEDGTLIINPGPCASGCYALLDIGESSGKGFSLKAELFG